MDSGTPSDSETGCGRSGSEDEDGTPSVNPAPPPAAGPLDAVLHSDAIGDTLYSERGLLRTLMALNAAVPRYLGLERSAGEGGDAEGDGAGESPEDGGGDEPPLMELDAELEEQLCQLWDMTAERAVAEFAAASGLLEVVWPLLDRSPCPRLLEIVSGALANCAGHGAKALPGGADTAAAAVGLLIAGSRGDAPVLRETLRLAQAAACAQPEPERLLRALAGWLPLLVDVLRGALFAPLLRQALGLLAAVAELPDRRAWWLGELAAVRELPAAVLEGLAQLVGGDGAGVTAAEALDCCRDSLLLLAEVEAMEGAEKPDTDSWVAPVPRLVRGVCEARRAAAASADPRLACCLLWLAAPALRLAWCDDTLASLLRFCEAAQRVSGDEDLPSDAEPAAEEPAEAPMEDGGAEARAELDQRLGATAAFLARQCVGSVTRFVVCSRRRREAALLMAVLDRAAPELADGLRLPPPADGGTHHL
ncbi:uncharacterized protein LOC122392038 isoform X2 [Amphibalanus amphitrite]|nr:uncharacterized protein LOC122392038 isoform X2 [Amphibalanus amphitrite]XP_043242465.1 uncharacterized protein LOC122392038 isoform X2 [Amphibalanus amphitrite]